MAIKKIVTTRNKIFAVGGPLGLGSTEKVAKIIRNGQGTYTVQGNAGGLCSFAANQVKSAE